MLKRTTKTAISHKLNTPRTTSPHPPASLKKLNADDAAPSAPSPNLTTEQAAKYLNVQPATLEQWRWNGKGPLFVKIGRSCRYRMADLEAFLDERVLGLLPKHKHKGGRHNEQRVNKNNEA